MRDHLTTGMTYQILPQIFWSTVWYLYLTHSKRVRETFPPLGDETIVKHNNLGEVLFQKGQVEAAIAQFQMALKIEPNFAMAHYNLGAALLQKGRVDEAIAQFQETLEIDPNNAKAHNNLGILFFQKGQADEAIAHVEEAVRQNPGNNNAQMNLVKMRVMLQKKPT
jgi:Flp pilus assembly protein TadD